MKKSRKIINKLAAFIMAFAVAFTMIPFAAGDLDAHAASYWKGLKVKATGQTTASVSWKKLTKKQRKKINGIAVFRNGAAVAYLGKSAKSFSDAGLNAGTSYTYQVKTYKKKTKKTKMWYNKATGKYQKKKPAKKIRGKRKTFKKVTYKYANSSPAVKVATAASVAAAKPSSSNSSSSGSTGGSTGTGSGGGTGDPTTPSATVVETINSIDYLGEAHSYVKKSDDKYYWTAAREVPMTDEERARVDRTVPGEFTISGGSVMVQTGGEDSATFYKKELNGEGFESIDLETTTSAMRYDMDQRFGFRMYGGDPAKLTYEVDHDINTVNTYAQSAGIKQYVSISRDYIEASDGTYLQRVLQMEVGKLKNPSKTAQYGFTCLLMKPDRSVGCGLTDETVAITIKYNGKKIGEISWDPFGNLSPVNGMTPNRALAWSIAQEAIAANGGKQDYNTDMRWIQQYFYDTYTYGQQLTGEGGASFSAGCEGGAFVLETYSIKEYGVYGFNGYGNKDPEQETHTSFNLNSDPEVFFETQGHR